MKRILLAEDEENIADFIRRGLESFGYQVDAVRSGDVAWKRRMQWLKRSSPRTNLTL